MSERNRLLLCCALAITQSACSGHPEKAHEAQQSVPLTSEPNHHLALENSYVRVFKVEAPPHAATLFHRHDHDYIFVVLGATLITNMVEGKPAIQQRLQDGEVRYVPGGFAHKVINDADTPFRNVTVEILQPKKDDPAKAEAARGLDIGHGASSVEDTLFVKDGVKASDVTLNPGGMLHPPDHKAPRLVIAVTPFDLRGGTSHGAAGRHLQAGDIYWIGPDADDAMLTNAGKSAARFVVLEFE